jgi:uncharacterized protein (TIGR02594 family)
VVITHLDLAHRYLGIHEKAGDQDHPLIRWWLSLVALPNSPDETPWCSAFMSGLAWELGLPRSLSAAARSWLKVGTPIALDDASTDHVDVVSAQTRRRSSSQVLEVLAAPGHVGLFHGLDAGGLHLLAGNQSNAVTVATFPRDQVLGVRRLTA